MLSMFEKFEKPLKVLNQLPIELPLNPIELPLKHHEMPYVYSMASHGHGHPMAIPWHPGAWSPRRRQTIWFVYLFV